jgi:hypothetical protein
MGKRGYPREFHHKVLYLVEAGRQIAEVATAMGISTQSISAWRRQDRTDKGLVPGLSGAEQEELAAAPAHRPAGSDPPTEPDPIIRDQPRLHWRFSTARTRLSSRPSFGDAFSLAEKGVGCVVRAAATAVTRVALFRQAARPGLVQA